MPSLPLNSYLMANFVIGTNALWCMLNKNSLEAVKIGHSQVKQKQLA